MTTDRMHDPYAMKLLQEGIDPTCTHEGLMESGRGTATLFWDCTQCGARFSQALDHNAANDPYLIEREQ